MNSFLEHLGQNGARSMPVPASKAEWVAASIERQIVDDGLEPGTLVGNREQLKTALDVAPSTITEGIRLLTARGLVTTRTGPGGGVFVAKANVMVRLSRTIMAVSGGPGEVADALEVRDQLEDAVIVGAAKRTVDADLAPLRASFRKMESAESFSAFYNCNLRFHLEIAELCRNEVLKGFYVATVRLIIDHDPQLRANPGEDQVVLLVERVAVHRMILDAISDRDPVAAQAASDAHSMRGHDRVAADGEGAVSDNAANSSISAETSRPVAYT